VSLNTDLYDPTAPEGEVGSRGQYMSRRDLKIILTSFVVIGILSVPIYHYLLQRTESSRCTRNMQGISEALTLYATEHDGRYPPIDRTESLQSIVPSLGESGHVYTWASDISGYMNARASFLCPSADPTELVVTEDPRGSNRSFPSSYGMYTAYGSCLTSLIENPDQAIVVAETSNRGALGSFDPTPYRSQSGQPLPDGFAIGWNDANDNPTSASKYVTRLAFSDAKDGHFTKEGPARHGDTIHVLSSSGQLMDVHPTISDFGTSKHVSPSWSLPPNSEATR
jgi:hypothetical protein